MKKLLLVLVLFAFVSATNLFADNSTDRAEDLGGPITISGGTYTDFTFKDADNDTDLDGLKNKTVIKISADLSENIRAFILMKFYHYFKKNGETHIYNDGDLEKWFNQAYIMIHNIDGVPMAFVVGKHEVAYGLGGGAYKMPIPENTPLWVPGRVDQVFGFTVSLKDVPFFDLVELSGFETEAGDFDIGEINGASVRLTKDITDKIKARISHINKNTDDLDETHNTSIGLIYKDGTWTGWFEGIYMNGSALFPNSDYGFSSGIAKQLEGGRVVVEVTYIQDSLWHYGLGFLIDIVENVQIGPEIRYNDYEDGREDGWQVAVRLIIKFKPKNN